MSCFLIPHLQGSRGVIWEHELYEPLQYNQDRTFFHTLEGDVSSKQDHLYPRSYSHRSIT